MKKLFEAYEADNGIFFKKQELVYHLFSNPTSIETTESVVIGNEKELFQFLLTYFADKVRFKDKVTLHQDSLNKHHSATIEWDEEEK